MRFLVLIPYHDEADAVPQVWLGYVSACSREEALHVVEYLQTDTRQLLALLVGPEVFEMEELQGLQGEDLLHEYGISVGEAQVWSSGDQRAVRATQVVLPPAWRLM